MQLATQISRFLTNCLAVSSKHSRALGEWAKSTITGLASFPTDSNRPATTVCFRPFCIILLLKPKNWAAPKAARAFETRQQSLAGLAPSVAAQDALQTRAAQLAGSGV